MISLASRYLSIKENHHHTPDVMIQMQVQREANAIRRFDIVLKNEGVVKNASHRSLPLPKVDKQIACLTFVIGTHIFAPFFHQQDTSSFLFDTQFFNNVSDAKSIATVDETTNQYLFNLISLLR